MREYINQKRLIISFYTLYTYLVGTWDGSVCVDSPRLDFSFSRVLMTNYACKLEINPLTFISKLYYSSIHISCYIICLLVCLFVCVWITWDFSTIFQTGPTSSALGLNQLKESSLVGVSKYEFQNSHHHPPVRVQSAASLTNTSRAGSSLRINNLETTRTPKRKRLLCKRFFKLLRFLWFKLGWWIMIMLFWIHGIWLYGRRIVFMLRYERFCRFMACMDIIAS